MVSRRNFLAITLIMFLVLFMFRFSEFMKNFYNDYGTNPYADSDTVLTQNTAIQTNDGAQAVADGNDYAVVIGSGSASSDTGRVIKQWCSYYSKNIIYVDDPSSYTPASQHMPEVIFIDSAGINYARYTEDIERIVNTGCTVIFCSLPSADTIKSNQRLSSLLGIRDVVHDNAAIRGIRLFDGFLLGGGKWYIADNKKEEKYQDMQTNAAWYALKAGSKVYMAGVHDDMYGEIANEDEPCIIWRYRTDKSCIFAINADYAQSNTALGIYSAMLYEAEGSIIYPVVNSQSVIAVNYPSFADENSEQMKKRYSRTMTEAMRDIIWPNLSGLTNRLGAKVTYMVTPQYNYKDSAGPDADELEYYFRLFRENGDEAGWAAYNLQDSTMRQKIVADYDTFRRNVPDYRLVSMYINASGRDKTMSLLKTSLLKDVRTVVTDYDATDRLFTYLSSNVTELRTTNDGLGYSYMNDFKNRCIETALGYSSVTLDMTDVLAPDDNSPEWSDVYENFAINLDGYLGSYGAFDKNTVSETDSRVRRFMAVRCSSVRDGNEIRVTLAGVQDETQSGLQNEARDVTYYVLRTHGEEIEAVDGGSFKKIEDGAYLISAQQREFTVKLKDADALRYTD